jgi:predicted NACHT family NTPase
MTADDLTGGIPVINWFDEPIKHSVKSVFDGINEKVEGWDLLKKYRNAHFDSLLQSVGNLKILGMGSPVKLTDIYYPAYISTTIHRRLYAKDWHSIRGGEDSHDEDINSKNNDLIRADDYVEAHNNIVVLGGPGTGKTTLLKYLAYAYSDKNTFVESKLKTSKFPIFIKLPHLAKSRLSIESFAARELQKKTDKFAVAFLKKVFKSGLAVTLLDSLDEVSTEFRADTMQKVRDFSENYPKCSVIMSCRTADYEEILESFYEVELARLTSDAVTKIVCAWFGEGDERAKRLLVHIKNDDVLLSLTENPLLLSLLCIQFRHDLSLPKRKAELYKRCVDALLRDWDASRGFRRDTIYANISDERKERIFEHVAEHFFHFFPRYVFPEKQLLKKIGEYINDRFEIPASDAKIILKEIESHHGILERISADLYGFSHPSFQEYFTAKCALSRRDDMKIVREKFSDENWDSVIEFIVALREDPEEHFQLMLKKSAVGTLKTYPAMARRTMNLCLLYRCLSTGAAISAKTSKSCYAHIVKSQIEMAIIYREGGVIPFAVLMPDGVRHAYYYWRKRKTLYDALQPLRKLANTIFAMPSKKYSDIALSIAKASESSEDSFVDDASLALCLVTPLASIVPGEVKDIFIKLKKKAEKSSRFDFFVRMINESLSNLP